MKRSALDAARQFAWRKKSMVNGITDSTTSCAGSANKKSWKNLLTFKKILIYWSPLWEIWTKKNNTSHFTQLAKNPALDSRGSTPASLTSSQPLRLALKSSTNSAKRKLSSSPNNNSATVGRVTRLAWLKSRQAAKKSLVCLRLTSTANAPSQYSQRLKFNCWLWYLNK